MARNTYVLHIFACSVLLTFIARSYYETRLPYVTQDNTPPGPIFKARLLHVDKSVGPEQGVRWKDLPDSFPKK